MNDAVLIWFVFVAFGTIFLAAQKTIKDKVLRELSYPLGIIMWIIAAYVWAIQYADTGFFPIVWVHLVPILLLSAFGVMEMGQNAGKVDKYNE